ncbi:unnamed protein product [Adineta ricciae]|uniref:Uncharacterized protein n=1 Tax=Adineta ricciae TaxID=249248 RepID=A0A815RTY8_ADIRI|nr:unnamed protein product [Adineta ricciae]CAF1481525.1 unnamed protein product [Adineta ricciae]
MDLSIRCSFSTPETVSIKRLRKALQEVIKKQTVLRTSFHIDPTTAERYQRIEELTDEGFIFVESKLCEKYCSDALQTLIIQERAPNIFPPEGARRVRLHIVRRHLRKAEKHGCEPDNNNEDSLHVGDFIILTTRNEVFDGTSVRYLLNDLVSAYRTGYLPIRNDAVTYLDYTIYTREMDTSASSAYWEELYQDLDVTKFVSRIPSDRS